MESDEQQLYLQRAQQLARKRTSAPLLLETVTGRSKDRAAVGLLKGGGGHGRHSVSVDQALECSNEKIFVWHCIAGHLVRLVAQ